MYFQLFRIFFELCGPFVCLLIAIGFELVGQVKEEWLYYLIAFSSKNLVLNFSKFS